MSHDADPALPLKATGEKPLGRVAGVPLVLYPVPGLPLSVPLDTHCLQKHSYCLLAG